jgi:hypothetical protein
VRKGQPVRRFAPLAPTAVSVRRSRAVVTAPWPVTGGEDQTAVVWDLNAGSPIAAWHGDAAIEATAWAEGKLIFIAGDDLGAVHILGLRA